MTGSAQGVGTVSGSDRVEIIWANNAIQQQWLEVIVKATTNTGLTSNAVFFYGNEIGDTGADNTATVARVTSSDVTGAQTHGASLAANIPITNIYDFDKNGKVDSADTTAAQLHGTSNATGLKLMSLATGSFAPAADAAAADFSIPDIGGLLGGLPGGIQDKLSALLNTNKGPLAKYFNHLAQEGTAEATQLLNQARTYAQMFGLPTNLLDSLLAKVSNLGGDAAAADFSISLPSSLDGIVDKIKSVLNMNTGPVAKYLNHLAHEGTAEATKVLNDLKTLASSLGINTSLLDSILAKLSAHAGDSSITSLLSGFSLPSIPGIPSSLLAKLDLGNLNLNTGPIAKYFEHLANEATDSAKQILDQVDDFADLFHIDDSLLTSLLSKIQH